VNIGEVTNALRLELLLDKALEVEQWRMRIRMRRREYTLHELDDAMVELVRRNPGVMTQELINACELTTLWSQHFDGVNHSYARVLGTRIIQVDAHWNYVKGEEPSDV
jgi:hypothetical protein